MEPSLKMKYFVNLLILFTAGHFPYCGASGIAAHETFCEVSADECAYVNAGYKTGGIFNRWCRAYPKIKAMMRARYKHSDGFLDGCDALRSENFVGQLKSTWNKIKDPHEAGTCIDCNRTVREDAPIPRAVRESREIRDFTRNREPETAPRDPLGDFFARGSGQQLLSVLSGPLAPQEPAPVAAYDNSINPFSLAANAEPYSPFSALSSPPQAFLPYYQPAAYRPALPNYINRAALENFGYGQMPQTPGYTLGSGHIYNGGSFPAQFPNHTSFLKFH